MNFDFSYYMPTRILFGAGKLKELETSNYIPGKKALIVIGATGAMKKHGYLERLTAILDKRNIEYIIFDKIKPNPISEQVDEGAQLAREKKCDFVIGLGGGSSIDSSKSIAVMAKNPGKYWNYIEGGSGGGKTPENGALPIVAITTTAGTGTEADPWTVITKSGSQEKIGWGNDDTFPTLSIVDPELMLSVPPKTTAYTGMDAFFHASEAYLATVNQPASDILSLQAVSLITQNLPIAVKDGSNLNARTKLAWANTAAGICESLSSCISHHSLEHAVSAFYPNVPHGAGLTMLSVAYFSFIAERNPDRFADIAKAMGEKVEGLSEKDRAFTYIKALKKLIKDCGLEDEKLSDYGVKESDLKEMAENDFKTMGGLFDVTPIKMTVDDALEIYKNAYR